jgi:nucleoside-diphosphate-sugar epimerase
MSRTIALTGATGFIGSVLARRLIEAGYKVQALVRPTSNRNQLSGFGIQWIEGSLKDIKSLRSLVHKAETVVHCAGTVRGNSQKQFNRVNVEGVADLVHAAVEQHPMPRFLLISSLAARQPQLSFYAASKRLGEERLAAGAGDMFWTAFRPSAVYGPGDREMLPLFRWIGRGIAPVPGSKDARFSLLHVDDLVDAVRLWLAHGRQNKAVFEIHDGHPHGYSWEEVISTTAQLYARRVMQVKVPLWLLKSLATLNLMAARTLGYKAMLSPGKVRELRHPDWVCDNAPLSREIGWKPGIGLKEGLRRTLMP